MKTTRTADRTEIEIALHAGIDALRADLGSGKLTAEQTTAAKNALISARILLARVGGASTREAMDSVLGAGTCDAVVKATYEGLRAKRAA